jgi:hypothetical protein
MAIINAALRWLFDVLLAPFASWPAIISLTLVSLAAGIGMLIVFKYTSNQDALEEVKRRIHAGIFEIRLFSDDLRAVMRAQIEILRANLTYVRLSPVPMVWIIVPFVLVMAQLQFHYGYEGLTPGRPAVLEVDLAEASDHRPTASLEVPEGLKAETDAIWLPSAHQVAWRIVPEHEGTYEVGIRVNDGPTVTKSIVVGKQVVRRSPVRHAGGFLDSVLFPAESPVPAGANAIRAIRIAYPDAKVNVFGWSLQWMIPFFALSIVFAFALRGPFKVTI